MKLAKATRGKLAPPKGTTIPGLWKDSFQAAVPVFSDFRSLAEDWPERYLMKVPTVDVSEDDKEVTVKAEVAGMSEKDLDLSHLDGVLYIKGEKKEEKEETGKNTWHKESWSGSFTRGIPLGENVDFSKAQAKYRNGVLQIRIPKIQAGTGKKPNSITIQ